MRRSIIITIIGLWSVSTVAAGILYVDDSAVGTNNGSSWQDAYLYLQDALAVAQASDEIRVAQGRYRPDLSACLDGLMEGDREASFRLKSGVTIKGGYAGIKEPEPDHRNIESYPTILNGDLQGNDTGTIDGTEENSLHILTVSEGQMVVDGFTITAGRGEPDRFRGSGIYKSGGHLTVSNCVLIRNWACCGYHGTSIFNGGGKLDIVNCVFEGTGLNEGIEGQPGSEEIVVNSIFLNHSQAGIMKYGNGLTVTNCLFALNEWGLFLDNGYPVISNTIFWNNGQDLMYDGGAEATLLNCYAGENPGFVAPDAGNFHLRDDSVCINAGDNAAIEGNVTDLEGNPRIVREVVDIGPYEYSGLRLIYVDDSAIGANDGSSWADAYLYLQDALAMANTGDEIRVAQGVYRPDDFLLSRRPNLGRKETFQLIGGVTLKGGYAGLGGLDLNARNIELYETILSGDIGAAGDSSDNSYHVVQGGDNAILEGFTVFGGNANGSFQGGYGIGGGLYNDNCRLVVANCIFEENAALNGGAIFSAGGTLAVYESTFMANLASQGGALVNLNSHVTLNRCVLSNNAQGTIFCFGNGTLRVESCVLDNNYGSWHAIDCSSTGTVIEVINSLLTHNAGGAISSAYNSLLIVNSTLADNHTTTFGGGVCCSYGSLNATNCIMWGNTAAWGGDEIFGADATTAVSYSCIAGDYAGIGNINQNPLFRAPASEDYHLLAESPCINAGDNAAIEGYATDLDGNPRIDGEEVDIGSYEYIEPMPLHVPQQYPTIQAAIDAAVDGATVLVADGTYTGDGNRDIDFLGKAIVVRSENGPDQCIIDCQGSSTAMRRGFYLHRGESHASIIDGFTIINGTGRIQAYTEGAGLCGGAIACVDSSATVRNCIIRNNESGFGAGIFLYRADVVVEGCTFSQNHNTKYGSAISSWESTALISDCQIENNTSQQGCAVYAWGAGAKTTLRNCSVVRNTGDTWVGGIGLWGESVLTGCVVQSNYGPGVGGIYAKANCILRNCLVTDNSSSGSAGGITIEPEISYPIESFAVIENCTIANNRTEGRTGGLDLDFRLARATIVNCIVWGNAGRWHNQIFTGGMASPATFSFCDIQGGWAGKGNIDSDPRFVDPMVGDYHLTQRSPCVNRGDPESIDAEPTDIDGDPRVMNGRIDIGADELFMVNTPPTAHAGNDMTGYAKPDGKAAIELDGSGSNDPDGDELEYVWFQDDKEIARGVHPTVSLPAGNHIIELIVSDGFEDSQPDELVVTVKEAIKAQTFVVPRIIHRRNHAWFLYAVITLPKGITAEDIDPRESFVLFPGAIDDILWRGMKQPKGRHTLLVAFDLRRFIKTVGQSGNVEVTIVGKLKSGPYLFATDNIRVIDRMTMRLGPNQR